MSETAESMLGLAPLSLGDVVRVRLSAECLGYWLSFFKRYSPHLPREDGQMGVVAEVDIGHDCEAPKDAGRCGHDYMLLVSSDDIRIGPYARAELERVRP